MVYIDERWKAYDEQLIAKAKPGIIAEAIADAFRKHNKYVCKLIIEQLCTRFGNVTDRLKNRLNAVKSPDTLASFIVLATSVESIKDFERDLEDALKHQHE
ncbi:hypothetical protein [Anaerobiospirillum sp. NML120449]|uniref:hypothetical protein n=1 Tax=Anaerobiospirillum sp. NML120449 TaxID=2932817 RepID=UPI001FF6901A|nr:hypothetical protein [Anaerobiospirillum sp. NML120449]MCK0527189.1 hypothetical protein [Anaerobiospirillum sp. NML120449]